MAWSFDTRLLEPVQLWDLPDCFTRSRRSPEPPGGRGVHFEDPSGHMLEIITRPYGSG